MHPSLNKNLITCSSMSSFKPSLTCTWLFSSSFFPFLLGEGGGEGAQIDVLGNVTS